MQGKLDDAVQHGIDMEKYADGAITRELRTVRDLQDERALRKKVEAEVKALKAERTKILESHATALKQRDTEHQAAELQAKGKAFLAGRKAERELQAAEIKRKETEFETERQNALASAENSAAKRLEEKDKELVSLRKDVKDLKVKVEAGSQKVAELAKAREEDIARLEKVVADNKGDYDSRLEEKDTEIATTKEEVASLKAKNNIYAEWWHRASEAMRSFPGRSEEEDVEMN